MHVFTFLKSTLAKEITYLAAELRGPQLSLIQCFEPLSHLIDCLLVPFQDLTDDMLLRLSQLLFESAVAESLPGLCHKHMEANINVRRIQQTSQSREKSHTWRERTSRKWQSLEERGELPQFQQESLEPPYVSEDFQSPPEEGDFVLNGRTLVKWTLQQGRTSTTTQPDNLMPVELGRSQWSSAHQAFFRHQPALLNLHLLTLFAPQDSLLWMPPHLLKLGTL